MVKFGLIGSGQIVRNFMEASKKSNGFQLQAFYSRTMEKAEQMAENYGAAQAFDCLDRMAEEPQIDAVYVASPNSCHFAQVRLMLEKGKHVLCEKPVTTNLREWESLLETARAHQVVLLEAMRPAFDPGFSKIEEWLPRLGTIRRATFQYSQYSSRYDTYKQGTVLNAFNPDLSNAALMDIGVYCIHGMVRLFGMPEAVTANSVFLENGMEAIGTVVAKYPHMLAEVMYSKITDSFQPSEIQGEAGSMQIRSIQVPREMELKLRDGTVESVKFDNPLNNMNEEIDAFIEMVEGHREAEFYQRISSLEMKVLDLARLDAGIVFPADSGD